MGLLGSSAAHASTWNGSDLNGSWNDAANWDTPPGNGSALVFTGSTGTTNTNDTGLTDVGLVTFSNGGFNVGGSGLILDSGMTNTAGNNTWGINSALNATPTITVTAGTLTLSGALSGNGALSRTGGAAARLRLPAITTLPEPSQWAPMGAPPIR